MHNSGLDIKETIVMEYPLVSIVTPVLNGSKYIRDCIESVVTQEYPYIEHVIIDGGSGDGTVEILNAYSAKHPKKIRFIYSPDSKPRNGPGEALNKGLIAAKGEIIGWLGADDTLFTQDAIRKIVQFFLSSPKAQFVHGGCNITNEKGEFIYTHKARDFTLDYLLNENNPIACPSAFYKRKVVETVGLLDEYGNDFDYMIRITKVFPIYWIEDVISNFRVHNESETGNLESYVKVLKKDYLVMRQHGGSIIQKRARRYYMFTLLKRLGLLSLVPFVRKLKKMTKRN